VRTVVLRAGNFIDPLGNGDVMSLLLLRSLRNGKLTTAGDPGVAQAYCYFPDWARAAVQLGERRHELATFDDIPFGGHTFSVEELHQFLTERLDTPLSLTRFPWWAMSLTAPFWELAREMLEVRYLWSTPHWLSNTKFERLVPDFRATPLAEVMLAGVPKDLRPSSSSRELSTAT
jgi:nucleoside-diphosphate-sugar epimerase